MAELDFYFTEDDELPIVTAGLDLGCTFVPDLHYPMAQYERVTTLEHYKQLRSRTRLFFLLSQQFERYPLEMDSIEKPGGTVYFVRQRVGGPTIDFMGGGLFDESGSRFIRPGYLAYHSTYWNSKKRRMEKAPAELVTTYQALVKAIRKSATRIKPGKRVYWLGDDAKRQLLTGVKLVGYEKYTAEDLLKRRAGHS